MARSKFLDHTMPLDVVRQALAVIVANHGSVPRAAEQIAKEPLLGEDGKEYRPAERTLRTWRDEKYSETYLDIERRNAQAIEDEIVAMQRQRVHRASQIELEMMEDLAKTAGGRDLSHALRAVADVKSKSLDGLLKLTGRDRAQQDSGSVEDLLRGMASKGYLRLNVSLEGPPANAPSSSPAIESSAEDE